MNTDPVIFNAAGEPRPKQSFKYTANGGGYTPAHVKQWQDHVSWRAKEAMQGREPIKGPVSVQLIFCLGDRRRVDCDNLSKAVLDAMRKIVFVDDCQVVNLHLVKHVADTPGVLISVFPGEDMPMMKGR